MHFNTRFICTEKSWFGGGIDMTPCLVDNTEKKYFHSELKKMCDFHNKKYYKNIRNVVMNIFIYHIEKNREV